MNFIFKKVAVYSTFLLVYIGYPSSGLAKSICVFCSSKDSIEQAYKPIAYNLGKKLANNNFGLVTGGRDSGLMKEVINGHASIKSSAPRYAIIPKSLEKHNVLHGSITKSNIIWTEDLHDRLRIFYTKCDAIVVMPGGFGAMQELMDSIENNKFGTIKKPVYILNTDHFWDPTLEQFKNMVAADALQESDLNYFTVVTSVDGLMKQLKTLQ